MNAYSITPKEESLLLVYLFCLGEFVIRLGWRNEWIITEILCWTYSKAKKSWTSLLRAENLKSSRGNWGCFTPISGVVKKNLLQTGRGPSCSCYFTPPPFWILPQGVELFLVLNFDAWMWFQGFEIGQCRPLGVSSDLRLLFLDVICSFSGKSIWDVCVLYESLLRYIYIMHT